MLSKNSIEKVKATVPALREYGTQIITVFYQDMLGENPHIRSMFDMERQKSGVQIQALANTVLAAAENIENLEKLLPAVNSIAKRHVETGVKEEHYPIVGKYLLQSIQKVLGDKATPEIIGAWGEAYQVIAKVFIDIENDMYAKMQ